MSMSEECDARDEHLPDRVEGWVNVYDAPTSGDLSLILYKTPVTQWKPSYCVLRIKRHRLLHFTSEKDAELPRKCRMAVVLRIGGTRDELDGESGSSVNISKSKSVQDQWTKAASKSPSASNERKCSSTSSAKDNGIVKSQLGDRRTSVPSIISYPSVEDSTDSPSAPNRLMNYISRKSSQIKSNFNLKRTRSSTKLDRKKPEIVVTNGGPEKESSPSFSSALKRTMSLSRLSRRFHGRARTAQETESAEQRPLRTAHSHESLLPTQASVPTTNFYLGSVDIKLIHGSILGKENCFQVSSLLGTKYYSCRTPSERQTWISQLRRTIQPVQDQYRRHERSLTLCISEAKNVPSKQRYYCEFSLDGTVYGRTSSKLKGDILLWSENFSFRNLQKFEKLSVNLYKDVDRKKKKDTNVLIGCVVIPLADIMTRQMVEQWFPVQVSPVKNSKDQTGDIPGIRLKARYLCVDILPFNCYQPLLEFVKQHYCHLVNELERLSVMVRAKDDLGCVLVDVLHSVGLAKDFIVGVLMDQVKRENDPKLLLRSNSIASKSIDAYMKLVGEKYLHETLKDFIKLVLDNQMSLDGNNTTSAVELQRKRDKLVEFCDIACYRIFNSLVHNHLPVELKHVFSALRKQLVVSGRDEDICRQLISSCFFLRFLSPAILNPNLFGLTQAFPEETDAHNLKLIAKTIMVLANFSRFGEGKEDSMVFLNSFIDKQTPNMKKFIDDISTCSEVTSSSMFECYVDAGRESALLHLLLKENLFKQVNETPTDDMKELHGILTDIDNALKTIPHLQNDRTSANDGRLSYESGTPMFMASSENPPTHSDRNIDQQTRFTSNTTVTLTTSTPTTPLDDLSGSSFFVNNMPGTRRTMREMQDSDRYTSLTSLGVLPIRPPMTESSVLFTNKATESTNGTTTQLLYAAETVDTDLTSEIMAFWENYLHDVSKGEEPTSPKNKPAPPPSQSSANCWPPNGSIKRNPKRQPLAFANPLFVYGAKSENNLDKFKKSGSLSSVNSAKGGRTVSPSPSVDGVAMSSVPACRLSTNSEFSEIQNYMSNLSNSILSRSMDFPLPPPRNAPGGLKRTNTEGLIIPQTEVMTTSINSPPESPSCSQSMGRRGLSNQGSVRMGIRSVQRKIVDNEKQYEVELRNLQHQLSATQALLQQEQSLRLEMEKDFQQKSRILEGEYMQRQVELEAEKRRLVERVEDLQSELERERSLRQQQDLKVETLTSSLGNMKFRHVSDIHATDRNCNTH